MNHLVRFTAYLTVRNRCVAPYSFIVRREAFFCWTCRAFPRFSFSGFGHEGRPEHKHVHTAILHDPISIYKFYGLGVGSFWSYEVNCISQNNRRSGSWHNTKILIYKSLFLTTYPGGAGSYLRSRRFSGFYDRPSKEICQPFENRNEHAHNAKITRGNRNMFRRHFCSGFAFDSITFYSLLAIFNDSSETIRTKGIQD